MIYSREELKILIQPILCFSKKTNRIDIKVKIDPLLKQQIILSTEGCRDERFSERVFWILNDIYDYPICTECGKQFRPRYYGLSTKNFNDNKFCSVKCAKSNVEVEEKRKQTCLEIYGVEHQWQSKQVIEQIKETNRKLYGVDHPLQNKEILKKLQETNKIRYGFECSLQNKHVQQKRIITWVEKYEVEHPLKNIKIHKKIKETNRVKIGVDYPLQNKHILQKTHNTNLERYGVENVMQNPEISEECHKKKFKYMVLPSGKEIYYQRI